MMRNHKGTKEGIKNETFCFLFVFFVPLWFYFSPPFMCYANEQSNKTATDITNSGNIPGEITASPEDYYFNVESVSTETEEGLGNLTFMDFFRSHLLFMVVTMKHSSPLVNFWMKMNSPFGLVNK